MSQSEPDQFEGLRSLFGPPNYFGQDAEPYSWVYNSADKHEPAKFIVAARVPLVCNIIISGHDSWHIKRRGGWIIVKTGVWDFDEKFRAVSQTPAWAGEYLKSYQRREDIHQIFKLGFNLIQVDRRYLTAELFNPPFGPEDKEEMKRLADNAGPRVTRLAEDLPAISRNEVKNLYKYDDSDMSWEELLFTEINISGVHKQKGKLDSSDNSSSSKLEFLADDKSSHGSWLSRLLSWFIPED